MAFIQIIDFNTSKFDEMQALGKEWEAATAGRRTTHRRIMTQDRDHPGRYLNIVFFDSYEAAMENSSLPETAALSAKMMALGDGPPTFLNLDVGDEVSD